MYSDNDLPDEVRADYLLNIFCLDNHKPKIDIVTAAEFVRDK